MKKIYRVASVRNVFRLNSKIREIQIILEPELPTENELERFYLYSLFGSITLKLPTIQF